MRSSNYNIYRSLSNYICNNLLITVPCNFGIVIITIASRFNKLSSVKAFIIATLLFLLELGFTTLLNHNTYKYGSKSVNRDEKQDFYITFFVGILTMTVFTLIFLPFAILFAIINCKLLLYFNDKEE